MQLSALEAGQRCSDSEGTLGAGHLNHVVPLFSSHCCLIILPSPTILVLVVVSESLNAGSLARSRTGRICALQLIGTLSGHVLSEGHLIFKAAMQPQLITRTFVAVARRKAKSLNDG